MKPFSLERAQAGDPIMIAPICGSLEWRPAHFVGLSRDGSPVVQIESVVITTPDRLRMAPRKRTVHVQIFAVEADTSLGSPAYRAVAFLEQQAAMRNINETQWPVLKTIAVEIEE